MLNPATAGSLARSRLRRVVLQPNLALRIALTVFAAVYVVGPSVAQWISLEQVRDEVAVTRVVPMPLMAEPTNSASPQVQQLLEDAAPSEMRELVAPGLVAAGELQDGAARLGATLAAAAVRAAQVVALALAVIVVGVRSTRRYRPRHAGGAAATLFSRRG